MLIAKVRQEENASKRSALLKLICKVCEVRKDLKEELADFSQTFFLLSNSLLRLYL